MAINGVFLSIAIIFILATLGAFLARAFRQPLIPAYILTGIIIGPAALGLIQDRELISLLAEIGIAFLLFIVGLELDLKKIKSTGFVASIGGTVQMVLLFITGWLVAFLVGFKTIEGLYIAIMLTFSSTFVVVKLLSDEKQLRSLHGRISIGFLLLQDIVAILVLSVLGTANGLTSSFLLFSLIKGSLLLLVTFLVSTTLFPAMFSFAARSKELLFLLSLAVLFLFSLFSIWLGFSIAIGAFVAGVALANLPYTYEIGARVKPLRDFFATMFFVALGMEFTHFAFTEALVPLLIFFLFTIFWKPIVTFFTCIIFGYSGRTSGQVGLSLAQVSEFSLIIAAQGLILGHLSQQTYGLIIIVTMATIAVSTYYVHYDGLIALKLSPLFKYFTKYCKEQRNRVKKKNFEILLVGCHRIGHGIFQALKKKKKKLLVIDFDPVVVKRLRKQDMNCIYGDIADFEILEELDFSKTKLVVSTAEDLESNMLLLKQIKKTRKDIVVFVTANMIEDSLRLYDAGADYVILPHFLGGNHVSVLIDETRKDFQRLIERKISHIKELKHRLDIGHRHPNE